MIDALLGDGTVLTTKQLGDMANVLENTVDFGPSDISGTSIRISKPGLILIVLQK